MQTFTGREYLKIDIANNYGLDKLDWDERIAWFDAHEGKLPQLVQEAEEPALFYAGVKAWRQVQADEPIGYMVSLDATSSGLQILAALTGDRKAAAICNVIDAGRRMDAYTEIFEGMRLALAVEEAATMQFTRAMAKHAVMTSLYGSTAIPKETFGEGPLLALFYDTMHKQAPAAWELNEAFRAMWNPRALSHDWVLPDNFHVHVKVMSTVTDVVEFRGQPYEVSHQVNAPEREGRGLGANTVHSIDGMVVREMTRRCDYDPQAVARVRHALEQAQKGAGGLSVDREADHLVAVLWGHYLASGYLSARILDHLDDANVGHVDPSVVQDLVDSLPERPFKLVSVHDCFRFLPHYGDAVRRQYNLQLQLIAKSNLLSFLVSQIVGHQVEVFKHDPDLWQDIADTNYALS